jgi:hypothetical protein
MRFNIAILIIFLTFSCANEDRYEEVFDIYEDILITRVRTIDSTEAQRKVDSILASRSLNEEDFRALLQDMSKNKKEFIPRLRKLRENILSKKDSIISSKN